MCWLVDFTAQPLSLHTVFEERFCSVLIAIATHCTFFFQFDDLNDLGYTGFSIGFYEEKVELVGTNETGTIFDSALIEYLHAKIKSGNLMIVK